MSKKERVGDDASFVVEIGDEFVIQSPRREHVATEVSAARIARIPPF